MSVLYIKGELNCGLGAINGEDASKAGGHGSQRARFPMSLHSVQLACFPVSLRTQGQLARLSVSLRTGRRSHAFRSVKVKQLSARHLLQPLKPRHVASREWLTEIWIYYNLKTRHLNVLSAINGARCLKFIPISCMGPKHAPKDTYLIFQPIYMHWSMCM